MPLPPAANQGYPAAFRPNPQETRGPMVPGGGPKYLFNATIIIPLPLVNFFGDQPIGASQDFSVDVATQMGGRCTGFILAAVVGSVQYSINGGGFRTCPSSIALNDAQINQIRVVTGVASSCVLQLNGV